MATNATQTTAQGMKTIWLVIMLVFIVELFAYTWCRVQSVRIKYEITAQSNSRKENLFHL